MSTGSFANAHRRRGHLEPQEAPEGWNGTRYRCLYCHRIFHSVDQLPSHEASCDARTIVRRGWQMTIEKARRAEK